MVASDIGEHRNPMFELPGQLFRRPPEADELEQLAGLFSVDRSLLAAAEDDRAAAHQTLFGLNVLPFASVFLEPDGMLGGGVTGAAAAFRLEAGMAAAESESPDHVAAEVELLGHLARASETEPGVAEQSLLCRFVDTHFFGWYPAFVRAVEAEGDPFYARLALHVLDEALKLRGRFDLRMTGAAPAFPAVPELLEADGTGVAEIARYFTTPVHCGIFLGRAGISRLGRGIRLPHGFGNRRQMLETLLHSAATYGGVQDVAEGIRAEIESTLSTWETAAARGPEALKYWADGWTVRLRDSSAALEAIVEALRSAS